MKQDKERWD